MKGRFAISLRQRSDDMRQGEVVKIASWMWRARDGERNQS
jgi:hypothetical protein